MKRLTLICLLFFFVSINISYSFENVTSSSVTPNLNLDGSWSGTIYYICPYDSGDAQVTISIDDFGNSRYRGIINIGDDEEYNFTGVYNRRILYACSEDGIIFRLEVGNGILKWISNDIVPSDDPCSAIGILYKN